MVARFVPTVMPARLHFREGPRENSNQDLVSCPTRRSAFYGGGKSVRRSPGCRSPSPRPRFSTPAAFDRSAPFTDWPGPHAGPRVPRPMRCGTSGKTRRRACRPGDAQRRSPARTGRRSRHPVPLCQLRGPEQPGQLQHLRRSASTRPIPVGDVGPNHYVEMVNLDFAVYDKTGNLLLGPVDTGTLWAGFAVPDCTDPSGDPVVLYDQLADRWLLTQFTTAGWTTRRCPSTTAWPSRRPATRPAPTTATRSSPAGQR